MSSLVHRSDQVAVDVVALECHRCRVRYSGDELVELLGFEELTCLDPDCRAGGMVALRRSTLAERFGEAFTGAWTPLPEALMDHAGNLGIGSNELLVIWALERHRRALGDEVFPGQQRIAGLTGLTIYQVRRALAKLVHRGLIDRRQPGREGKRGRAKVRYVLDPLWTAVTHLVSASDNQTSEPAPFGEQQDSPNNSDNVVFGFGEHRGPDLVSTTGPIWCAPEHHEVDVVEIDAIEEDPAGTSPAPTTESSAVAEAPAPDLAAVDDLPTDAERELSKRFAAFRAEHPKITNPLQAWRRFAAEQEAA